MTDITRNGISATDANTDLSIIGNGTGVPDLESGYKVNGIVETLTGVAPGTSGNILTSNGSVWTSAAASGGAWTYISSATASASASIAFTGLSSTYVQYMVVFEDVVMSADSSYLGLRTSTNGGTSYDSGASDYDYHTPTVQGSTSAYGASTGAANAEINFCIGIGTAAGEGIKWNDLHS